MYRHCEYDRFGILAWGPSQVWNTNRHVSRCPKHMKASLAFLIFFICLCYKSKVLEAAKCSASWAEATSALKLHLRPISIYLFIANWNHSLTYVKRVLHCRASLLLPTVISSILLFSFVCLLPGSPGCASLTRLLIVLCEYRLPQTWHWLQSLFLVLSLLLSCLEVRTCWMCLRLASDSQSSGFSFPNAIMCNAQAAIKCHHTQLNSMLYVWSFLLAVFSYINVC